MSHELFSKEGDGGSMLPDTRIKTPPPEEEVELGDPASLGIEPAVTSEINETSSMMFQDKKLLDGIDARDWRKTNSKLAPGQRGKDKKPRKKPLLTEKRLVALAKAREASAEKAKQRRIQRGLERPGDSPAKEIKMEIKEKEAPKDAVAVVEDKKTVPKSPSIDNTLKPKDEIREEEKEFLTATPLQVRETKKPVPRTYTMDEFERFASIMQQHPRTPAKQIVPHSIPIQAPRKQTQAVRNPKPIPKVKKPSRPKSQWDDLFI